MNLKARIPLLSVLGALLLLALGTVALGGVLRIRADWDDFLKEADTKRADLIEVRSAIGYAHAVDRFRIYVLRGHPDDLDQFYAGVTDAEDAIDRYRYVGSLTRPEVAALARLDEMLVAYRQAAQTAEAMRRTGATTADIDTATRIDDRPYEAALQVLADELDRLTGQAKERIEGHTRLADLAVATIMPLGLVLFGVTAVRLHQSSSRTLLSLEVTERERSSLVADLEADAARQRFEHRLRGAVDMARDEPDVYEVAQRAVDLVAPGVRSELYLADSSRAHLHLVMNTEAGRGTSGCGVDRPHDCEAIRRGQTVAFANSEDFDACPFLHERGGPPCSALCVPLTVAGHSVGVLHTTTPATDPLPEPAVAALEELVNRVGDRVGMLRAFEQSHTQASTDPLTGLLNRRSLENRVREIEEGDGEYAVVYSDLDHFKVLNDTHGHVSGDRALRLYSQTLQRSLRPTDIAARWGGEEFLCVLARTTTAEAVMVAERIREALALALLDGRLPRFTASFGISDSTGWGFAEAAAAADEALLEAKRAGRDRIVVAGNEAGQEAHEATRR